MLVLHAFRVVASAGWAPTAALFEISAMFDLVTRPAGCAFPPFPHFSSR